MTGDGRARNRFVIASGGIVIASLSALILSGCAADAVTEATVGIGRGGQRAEVMGVVAVCSGVVDGLDLSAADTAPLPIGDRLRHITRWVSPDPVTDLGETDLAGPTRWPADTEIEQFGLGVDYSLAPYTTNRSVLSRPVVFRAEQFDTLSVGEVIVGGIRDGTSETLSIREFLGRACEPR